MAKGECTGESHIRLTEKVGSGGPLQIKVKGGTAWTRGSDCNITVSVVLMGFGDGRGQMVMLNHLRQCRNNYPHVLEVGVVIKGLHL